MTPYREPDWAKEIHFRDARTPHQIRVQLERKLMRLFRTGQDDDGRLMFKCAMESGGILYNFELRLDEARMLSNYYRLRVEGRWPKLVAGRHEDSVRSSESWFKFWTGDFHAAQAPDEGDGLAAGRYRKLVQESLPAESELVDVGSIQQSILAALRSGASFSTARKEGGTTILARGRQFIRADYGESKLVETFDDEAAFLAFLRKFYE